MPASWSAQDLGKNTASNPIRSGCFPDVHSFSSPPNLVLRHGDNMLIAALSAASWCAERQSRTAAIAFKAVVEGV